MVLEIPRSQQLDIVELDEEECILVPGLPEPMNRVTPSRLYRVFIINLTGRPPSILQLDRTMPYDEIEKALNKEVASLLRVRGHRLEI